MANAHLLPLIERDQRLKRVIRTLRILSIV
jgi:hypothetical protein